MAHQLRSPLSGSPPQEPQPPPQYHSSDLEMHHHQQQQQQQHESSSMPECYPWCSVTGCKERPLRQYAAASSKQIMFMCKTHFNTVPVNTREGWKQYRGTRTFPEAKVAVSCRPGPNRGHMAAAAAAAAAAAEASEVDPGYTNHPDDEKANRGPPKSALWPGRVYNVLYQVWNAHAEQKKIKTGDGYMTSSDRAALVPEAIKRLREVGNQDMANILDNTTEGARKVIHSRVLAKYLRNRHVFSAKLRTIGLDQDEVDEWEAALSAAQHHADLAPSRDRDSQAHSLPRSLSQAVASLPHVRPQDNDAHSEEAGDLGGGAAAVAAASAAAAAAASSPGAGAAPAESEPEQPLYNNGGGAGGEGRGGALMIRKKAGRKQGKNKLTNSPEAKRARTLDSMVSAVERSNLLQQGAAEAGAEHMRRLELADAERLGMEKEEHALRMAIGKAALTLLNKMAGESPPQLSLPDAPEAPPAPTPPPREPGSGPVG